MSDLIIINQDTDALLVIDIQPTFMPGGGLAVAGGDEIVPIVRSLMERFPLERRFATKDRHPRGHISLASSYRGMQPFTTLTVERAENPLPLLDYHVLFSRKDLQKYLASVGSQILWPDHAIAGTKEAELHPMISERDLMDVVTKGTDPRCDSYSGFRDNLKRPTGLAEILRAYGITRVFCSGLAYDFCVGWTALDAVADGFEAIVVKDATRPVALGDSAAKIEAAFAEKGVRIVQSSDIR